MKNFALLFKQLDETTKTNSKVSALVDYFRSTPPDDAVWTISFLIGRKPKQIIPTKKLVEWSSELAKIPEWLFGESYQAVGDLAETITLLLPKPETSTNIPLHVWVEELLLPLRKKDEQIQKEAVISSWLQMNNRERFVYNKLITGSFRVGVSASIVIKAIAKHTQINEKIIAHRLMGDWTPSGQFYNFLMSPETGSSDISKPYPFYLAYALDGEVESLGSADEWQVEWKWDGIRSQLIKRANEIFIWSRGEELINERFPELAESAKFLPDGIVIDGEILAWKDNMPLPFADLQKRIGRKNLTKKIIQDIPAAIIAYDIIEHEHIDIRNLPLTERREILNSILNKTGDSRIILSPIVNSSSWAELSNIREESRSRNVEGFMLKRKNSIYKSGRRKGDWWKWKIAPLTVDAVLIYAQPGSGIRSNLFTDYTFGVWDNGNLVPFAKAYSGLTNEEIREVDSFVRKNTLEKFGPVRTVKPELVFELAFEGIQLSTRHKSGVAVRFPRILRWRKDKKPEEADSLKNVILMISKSPSK